MKNSSNDYLSNYRTHLEDVYQKSQEDFDKTVLFLSSGSLGISFAFIKEIIGDNQIINPKLLVFSWSSWGLSLVFVLVSHLLSSFALRKAINQVDDNNISKRLGGNFDLLNLIFTILSGALFVVGLIFIIVFVFTNMS